MFSSEIRNIHIPLFIPRRGKGVTEVLCACCVSTRVFIDPLVFINTFTLYAKKSCAIDIPQEIAETLAKQYKLSYLQLHMQFSLSLDRVSSQFTNVQFELLCGYRVTISRGVSHLEMIVNLPVRVQDIIPIPGHIKFALKNPSPTFFFEDLVDHIQKTIGVILYPLAAAADRDKLKEVLDAGKSPHDMLMLLQEASVRKKVGEGGEVSVYNTDVYSTYHFEHTVRW